MHVHPLQSTVGKNPVDYYLLRAQKALLLLLILIVPVGWRYITQQPFAISWINVVSGIFLVVTGLRVLIQLAKHRPTLPAFNRSYLPELVVAALVVVAMLIGTLSTPQLRDAFGYLTSRFLQPVLVASSLVWLIRRKEVVLEEVVMSLVVSLVVPVLWGLSQMFHILPFQDTNRVTAGYAFPNTFARLIGGLLVLLAPLVLIVRAKWRAAVIVALLVTAVVFLRTYSYNAVASAGIAALVMVGFLPRRWRLIQLSGIAVIMLGIMGAIIFAPNLPKWQMTITSSRETRLQFWEVARGVIRDNPTTGIGFKSWEKRYPELLVRYATPPLRLLTSPQPHNFYLDSGVKAGILGLIAFPLLFLLPAVRGIQVAWRRRGQVWGIPEALALGITGFSVFMLCFGLLDDPLWSDDIVMLIYPVFVGAALLMADKQHVSD